VIFYVTKVGKYYRIKDMIIIAGLLPPERPEIVVKGEKERTL